jgi:CHAT domain-containing protein
LGRALLTPIESAGLLDGVDHIWFVPDDVLHLVPFATLVTERDAEGPGYAVSQFPSIAAAFRTSDHPVAGAPLVAFGAGGGSGTLAEMLSIRRLGGHVYVGARATETAWKRQSVAASAIHFGGHATPRGRSQWATALQLRADSANDGLLTLAEILANPLHGAVVVLLGCDTAARPEQPGPAAYYRQVPSLGEAFLDAGARAVIGNLWPITEEDARLMAQEFYGAGGPAGGAAALEQARAALRRRFPDMPRRWAGAVWLGVAEPMPATSNLRGR